MFVWARRLARLGRRPDTAEVRGSNPRGPTRQHFYIKNQDNISKGFFQWLCKIRFLEEESEVPPSALSYDIVLLLSYDNFHSLHSPLETMKSRVNLGTPPCCKAEIRTGPSPCFRSLIRGVTFQELLARLGDVLLKFGTDILR